MPSPLDLLIIVILAVLVTIVALLVVLLRRQNSSGDVQLREVNQRLRDEIAELKRRPN